MQERYIITVTYQGQSAYIIEQKGELFVTFRRDEAAVYTKMLDARCAKCYIEDRYEPRIVSLAEAQE